MSLSCGLQRIGLYTDTNQNYHKEYLPDLLLDLSLYYSKLDGWPDSDFRKPTQHRTSQKSACDLELEDIVERNNLRHDTSARNFTLGGTLRHVKRRQNSELFLLLFIHFELEQLQ